MRKFMKPILLVSAAFCCAWADGASCDKPVCNTNCQSPGDPDDCLMCCVVNDGGGQIACTECCDRGFDQGTQKWRSCNNHCSHVGNSLPSGDGGITF